MQTWENDMISLLNSLTPNQFHSNQASKAQPTGRLRAARAALFANITPRKFQNFDTHPSSWLLEVGSKKVGSTIELASPLSPSCGLELRGGSCLMVIGMRSQTRHRNIRVFVCFLPLHGLLHGYVCVCVCVFTVA
ncbi:unnamed protein product [Periconia digitata]|uniref:Uncharacterized protein n=1 Tax=Periconia digitata TaxID=1303443 RepID=A0A9W4UWN6_9PLEO|nr:unnamed protein product [Periconia digitata]